MRVTYTYVRGAFASWDQLFAQAAEFASSIPRDQLIGISHSCDKSDAVVTIWYWSEETEPGDRSL